MFTILLLAAAVTTTSEKNPLDMSSRDLQKFNRKPVTVEERLKIKAACTEPNGDTYDSDQAGYTKCMRDADLRKKDDSFSLDPNAPHKVSGQSVKIEF